MNKTILAGLALVLAAAMPAGADASLPNTVTANDGRLHAGCSFVRGAQDLDLTPVEIRGWAAAAPDGSIQLTCTVSSSSRSGTASADGAVVVTAEGVAYLGAGSTTVCVEARATYTIDIPPNEVSRCETFDLQEPRT